MFGTVAKLSVKPGHAAALMELSEQWAREGAFDNALSQVVFRLDNEPDTFILAAVFADREAYRANAESPEQHGRYLAYREHLAAEPEWMDGDVVQAHQFQPYPMRG